MIAACPDRLIIVGKSSTLNSLNSVFPLGETGGFGKTDRVPEEEGDPAEFCADPAGGDPDPSGSSSGSSSSEFCGASELSTPLGSSPPAGAVG